MLLDEIDERGVALYRAPMMANAGRGERETKQINRGVRYDSATNLKNA